MMCNSSRLSVARLDISLTTFDLLVLSRASRAIDISRRAAVNQEAIAISPLPLVLLGRLNFRRCNGVALQLTCEIDHLSREDTQLLVVLLREPIDLSLRHE